LSEPGNMQAPAGMTRVDVDALRIIGVLFFVLVGAEIFFVLADAIINVGELSELGAVRRFFNIAREDGVASWPPDGGKPGGVS